MERSTCTTARFCFFWRQNRGTWLGRGTNQPPHANAITLGGRRGLCYVPRMIAAATAVLV